MLEKLEEYIIAKSVPEAVRLLRRKPSGSAVAITGAIDHHWWRLQNAKRLIDTSRLGLNKIKLDQAGLHLGATTMLEDIVESKTCARFADGTITAGALSLASPLRRATTSLAALMINAVSVVDIMPALMALDAKVKVAGERRRTLPLAELFAGKGRAVLDRELLIEVIVPKLKPKTGVGLERHALTPSDDPILTAAAVVRLSKGKIAEARVAIGGGVTVPVRMFDEEKALIGEAPSVDLFARMGERAAKAINPVDDTRVSADHRRAVCAPLVRRALTRAAGLESDR